VTRLLLVDDALEVAQIVQYLARRCGQQVDWQTDVPSAWDRLHDPAAPRPDLILIDVNLPGVCGLELYRRLQAEDGEQAPPPASVAGPGPPGQPVQGLPASPAPPAALFIQWSLTELIVEGLRAGIDFLVPKDLLGQPDNWRPRIDEVLELAAHPPTLPARGPVLTLAALQSFLRHPMLRRLGDDLVVALFERATRRALGESPIGKPSMIDLWTTSANLIQSIAPLAGSHPAFLADLVPALLYQVEGLLGKSDSAPLRQLLAALPGTAGTG
jgi:CheY-like chemotaxis protein